MNDLLFDASWWMLAVGLTAGVAVWWQGNKRQDATIQRVGLGVFLAAVAWGLTSFFVDTDKESVTRKTRRIVQSVSRRDWDSLNNLLDERTSFPPFYNNRTDIVDGARKTADAIGLKSARVLGTNVQQNDTVIVVEFRALSEQERTMGQQTLTTWRFDWQNRGNGWKLYTITPLRGETIGPDQIIRNLERLR
jgi:hypothetical protein